MFETQKSSLSQLRFRYFKKNFRPSQLQQCNSETVENSVNWTVFDKLDFSGGFILQQQEGHSNQFCVDCRGQITELPLLAGKSNLTFNFQNHGTISHLFELRVLLQCAEVFHLSICLSLGKDFRNSPRSVICKVCCLINLFWCLFFYCTKQDV